MGASIPDPPELDLRARLYASHFYELASHRSWTYILTPTEKGFVSNPKPEPLRVSEVTAWLDESGLDGDERDDVFAAVRALDRAWREEWQAKNQWQSL